MNLDYFERERENTKMLFKTLMWNQQNLMIYLVLFHRIILLLPSKIRTLYPSNGPDVNIRNIYQTKSQMNKKRIILHFSFFSFGPILSPHFLKPWGFYFELTNFFHYIHKIIFPLRTVTFNWNTFVSPSNSNIDTQNLF